MCASTRFPEAIPLKNIKSKSVVKALVKFFTLFGLPKVENIDCKIQIEDEYFVKSDPDWAKLQNNDILRNLDQKLSHSKPLQRHELSKLILEYKQLFLDVPTVTHKMMSTLVVHYQ